MELLYLKAVHIVFVVTWFAGLFYLPRLQVYAAENNSADIVEAVKTAMAGQLLLMQKRLLLGIMWPSAIITFLLGGRLLMIYPLTQWLWVKLIFVLVLYFFHFSLHRIYTQQAAGIYRYSGQQLRMWNEVPTVILVAVVFLVVLKNTVSFIWGLAGLAALIVLLMTAILLYKKYRKSGK